MRFARHLVSHLTPEWRKHYIHYEELKKKVYEMVDLKSPADDNDETQLILERPVDTLLQDLFFSDIAEQLAMVESFYRAQEAKLSHTLRNLKLEITLYEQLKQNPNTSKSRSTVRKKKNIILLLSEYYLNLSLLQNYQQLNHTGFRKILKKHDKIATSTRGKDFFKDKVCKNYFWSSKHLAELIETTEGLMINNMEGGNRSKAMNRLRVPPLESKDVRSHWVTLRAGWLMGVIFMSLIILSVGVALRPLDSWDRNDLDPTLHGLRIGFLLTIWFYAFAINTYEWRRAGVNSVLIFEFNPRDYLNFVQLFEVASVVGVVFLVGLYFTVFSYWLNIPIWAGPVIMLGLILIFFFLPLPILFYKSRIWLLKKLGRIALAPFFPVEFPDFWIADQMNSLAIVILDVEFFLCYTLLDLTNPAFGFQCGTVSYGVRAVVAVLPAWFRFAQCLRRYYDTRQVFPHLVNAGKYSTSFFVVFFASVAFGLRVDGVDIQCAGYYVCYVLWIIAHIVSSTYTFTWDIRVDWGLFEGRHFLREELIYSSKVFYYLAIVEDLILRSIWTVDIYLGSEGLFLLNNTLLGTIRGVLEIFRRFVWNFFRVENEHLNNVGEFRAVRDISIQPVDLSKMNDAQSDIMLDDVQVQGGSQQLRRRRSSLHTIANGPPDTQQGLFNPMALKDLEAIEETEKLDQEAFRETNV